MFGKKKNKEPLPVYCSKCGKALYELPVILNGWYDPANGDHYYDKVIFLLCPEIKEQGRLEDFFKEDAFTRAHRELNADGHYHKAISIEKVVDLNKKKNEGQYSDLVESVSDLLG